MNRQQPNHADRDAASLRILGYFFAILGALVLFATLWTLGKPHAMIVNLASGALLCGLGGMMIWFSKRM